MLSHVSSVKTEILLMTAPLLCEQLLDRNKADQRTLLSALYVLE